MLQADDSVFTERHQVSEEKPVGGLDHVVGTLGFLRSSRAHGMPREGKSHIESTPIIPASCPLFRAGAVSLGRQAVVEEKPRVWYSEQTKLEALRQTLGLETTVKFIPAQSQENLPAFYNAAEVLVMPSHYESFGMVALEALACGTPVIATDVTGISPLVRTFPRGHIISANNPILLAQKLALVLSHPPIAASDTRKILAALDWQETAKTVGNVYTQRSNTL